MKYNHKKIEAKWQKEWEKKKLYHTPDIKKGSDNFYALVEFPYPSGNLHTGHWYAFSVPDIFVRAKRMQGANVMFPVGFDAFGLPAENAAIKRKLNPRKWTYGNIAYMRKQLRSMGASFDWSREVVTCDSEYYRWTQWIFIQLFNAGLAYQAETSVNWCASCKTVLANEQVVAGKCERCGSIVEQRTMKQWMLRITCYAEKLLQGLDKLNWPEEIKEAQRNWIGKSEGAEIEFPISNSQFSINVFTTRPDTLFGATYMVLAPEHALVRDLKSKIKNQREVEEYIRKTKSKTELERQQEKHKTGVELKGIKAINPATKEEIPIFIADYVLAHYGTGAIMAVPAHDERDFEFAKKFDLPIVPVIMPEKQEIYHTQSFKPEKKQDFITHSISRSLAQAPTTNPGILINSGKFDGMKSEEAKCAITEFVGGKMTVQYKLRDWVLSRQRYWGTPIPLVYCAHCRDKIKNPRLPIGGQEKLKPKNEGEKQNPGWVAVPEKDLPVKLPEIKDYLPTGDGKSPLAKVKKWVSIKCPRCRSDAERETDTMDTFVDSSWYFLRYCDPNNKKRFASDKKMKLWMPVDRYSGGAEHTTMHLLYSRFWIKAMHDLGLIVWDEPYTVRMNRGLIFGPDGQKMSKSKGNVVDPDEYVKKLGADTVRMYLAFIGPYSEGGSYPWNPRGILGIRRFLDRVWKLTQKFEKTTAKKNYYVSVGGAKLITTEENTKLVRRITHKTIQKVSQDINNFHFNTAIASLMVLLNEFESYALSGELFRSEFLIFLKLLAPFAPHITEELWQQFFENSKLETRNSKQTINLQTKTHKTKTKTRSIHMEKWPAYDQTLVENDTFELVIQVNGKVRDKVNAPIDISQKEAERLTFSREKVKNILGSNQARKVIFVPRRLINIVV